MKTLDKLIEMWAEAQIIPHETATTDDIVAFERTYKVVLPLDLVKYFQLVNGTGGDYDAFSNCFLPLRDVRPLAVVDSLELPGMDTRSLFVLADELLGSSYLTTILTPDSSSDSRVYLIAPLGRTGRAYFVSSSFDGFLEKYLDDGRLSSMM